VAGLGTVEAAAGVQVRSVAAAVAVAAQVSMVEVATADMAAFRAVAAAVVAGVLKAPVDRAMVHPEWFASVTVLKVKTRRALPYFFLE